MATALTDQVPEDSYGDLLQMGTGTGGGLSTTLAPVADGNGDTSPLQLATTKINIDRSGGNEFQLDGVALTATAAQLNTAGAGQTATFITATANTDLPNERVLTGTSAEITVTDNGAGSTMVLSIPTAVTFTGKTVTGGTFETNTFNNPTITGTLTADIAITAQSFKPTSSTAPTNGLYLPSANTPGISANSTLVAQFSSSTVTLGTTAVTTKIKGADTTADIDMVTATGVFGGGRGFWWEASVLGAPGSGGWVDFDGTHNRFNVVSTGAHDFFSHSGGARQFRIAATASADRYAIVTGGVSGSGTVATLSTSGGNFAINPGGLVSAQFGGVDAAGRYLIFTGATGAGNPSLSVSGGSVDITSTTLLSASMTIASGVNITGAGNNRIGLVDITDPNNQGFRLGYSGSSYLHSLSQTSDAFTINQYNGSAWSTKMTMAAGGDLTFAGSMTVQGATGSAPFTITNASAPELRITDTTTPVSLQFFADDSAGYIGTLTSHNVNFRTAGINQFVVAHTGSAVNYMTITGGTSGQGTTFMYNEGSGTNIDMAFYTKGTGTYTFGTAGNGSGNQQFKITHTASAVNFLQATGGATGGNAKLYATGSDSNVFGAYIAKGSGGHIFATNADENTRQLMITHTASASRYITITGSNGGNPTISTSAGSLAITPAVVFSGTVTQSCASSGDIAIFTTSANNGTGIYINSNTTDQIDIVGYDGGAANALNFRPGGTPGSGYLLAVAGDHYLRAADGTNQLHISPTSSAVNYVVISGDVTGQGAKVDSAGSDTNVDLKARTKGSGTFYVQTNSASPVTQFAVTHTASAVNHPGATGNTTGNPAILEARGSDTNVDLLLRGKGTGVVMFGTRSAIGAETVTGYITIKDSGGTERKLAVVS